MIVKNEEDFLDASLKSVINILALDDLVVVDTGSTDKTKEIAETNGARLFEFEWIRDFSAARNYAADKAINDWVLYLDADEVIKDADINFLNNFINTTGTSSVGSISMIAHPSLETSQWTRFYNRKTHRLEGTIHEQIVPIGNYSREIVPMAITGIHYGYDPQVKASKGKFERNSTMLEEALQKQPDDPYILAQLGKCYYVNGMDLYKACDYFERALTIGDDYRLEYIYTSVEQYGYSLLNTEQYEKALEHIHKYSKLYNHKPEFQFLSAHIFQNNGLFQEAVESYESCINADIFDPQGITSFLSYYNIGVILECVGMIEDAIEMYKKCGDYEPALKRLVELIPT